MDRSIVREFIDQSPENTLKNHNNDKAFETPLVAYQRVMTLCTRHIKDHVGPFYLTPWEIFSLTYHLLNVKPKEFTVIR